MGTVQSATGGEHEFVDFHQNNDISADANQIHFMLKEAWAMRQSDNEKITFGPFSDARFGADCDGHSPSLGIRCPEKAFACWSRVRTMLVASCTVLMVMFCSWTYGQAGIEAGTVTGTVKDPTGAVVVGASCILTDQATNVSQIAISTSAGAYTIPFVNTGTYTLKVEAKGFETYRLGL